MHSKSPIQGEAKQYAHTPHHMAAHGPFMGFHQEREKWNKGIKTKTITHNLIGPHVRDKYVGSNEAPSHHRHSTTITHQPPVPVDCLEQVLKVPRTHSTL